MCKFFRAFISFYLGFGHVLFFTFHFMNVANHQTATDISITQLSGFMWERLPAAINMLLMMLYRSKMPLLHLFFRVISFESRKVNQPGYRPAAGNWRRRLGGHIHDITAQDAICVLMRFL
jgi:4-alpha-glucanotransferase